MAKVIDRFYILLIGQWKLACLLLFLIPSLHSCGQKKGETTNNQQVLADTSLPQPRGWVSDFENLFTPDQIKILDSLISAHEKESGNEIAVVTLLPASSSEADEDFDGYSLRLFSNWGVGKKEKDNGIGILLSEKLRRVRIEVGYGLELKLTDKEAKEIIDIIMLPAFKEGRYFEGVSRGLDAIFKEIK